ncbi:MAG: hypothetical protein ACRDY3_05300 [Acidimicrobiales bacterium]
MTLAAIVTSGAWAVSAAAAAGAAPVAGGVTSSAGVHAPATVGTATVPRRRHVGDVIVVAQVDPDAEPAAGISDGAVVGLGKAAVNDPICDCQDTQAKRLASINPARGNFS